MKSERGMRVALLGILLAAGAATPAWAHAMLRKAEPPVGAVVPQAPGAVTITFSEGVEPAFSTIVVENAAGARVDRGDVRLAPGDGKRLTVSLQALPPGNYRVIWHVTSVDTHKTGGSFTFTVGR